ncbi:hypothetical protein [Clostridium botulinum]|nr:hypothetical protein [Clostridium botulinum]
MMKNKKNKKNKLKKNLLKKIEIFLPVALFINCVFNILKNFKDIFF